MIGDVVERCDRGAGRDERPRTHLPQAKDAVERRRDHAIRELRTDDVHARLGRIAIRAQRVELALRDDLRRREFLAARELALGLLISRAGLLETGELGTARQIHDHVAGPHQVAAVEADLADRLADFRGQRDRFFRACGPERLDGVAPLDRRDFRRDDDGRGRRFARRRGRRRHSRRAARPTRAPLPKHENTKIGAYDSSGFQC